MSSNPYKDFYEASKRSDEWAEVDKAKARKRIEDMEYARQIAAIAESIANEYIAQGEKQKAICDLEKSLIIYRILDGDDCEMVKGLVERIKTLKQ